MTFPKIFKEWYQTAVIGKWHLGTTPTVDYSKVLTNWGGQGTYFNLIFVLMEKIL